MNKQEILYYPILHLDANYIKAVFDVLFAGIVLIDNVTRSSIHSLLKTREEKEEHIYPGSYKTIQSSLFIFFVDKCHGIVVMFPISLFNWEIFK